MHGGHALAFVAPLESAVREMNLHALRQQITPQDTDLLTLANAVGGNQRGFDFRVVMHVGGSLVMPARHIVESTEAAFVAPDEFHVLHLFRRAPLVADEWRIAQHIAALLRRQHIAPVEAQRVAAGDGGAVHQRHGGAGSAEAFGGFEVHLVVGDPHGDTGDMRGGFVDLDAIELIDLDAAQCGDIEQAATAGVGEADVAHRFDGVHFQLAQFAEANHEEVAAAAGGVEKSKRR